MSLEALLTDLACCRHAAALNTPGSSRNNIFKQCKRLFASVPFLLISAIYNIFGALVKVRSCQITGRPASELLPSPFVHPGVCDAAAVLSCLTSPGAAAQEARLPGS